LWTAWLEDEDGGISLITPADVQMMMALHKMARQKHRHQRDNLTDICGYVNIYEETLEEMHGPHSPDPVRAQDVA
jgi:hypothetical protein